MNALSSGAHTHTQNKKTLELTLLKSGEKQGRDLGGLSDRLKSFLRLKPFQPGSYAPSVILGLCLVRRDLLKNTKKEEKKEEESDSCIDC